MISFLYLKLLHIFDNGKQSVLENSTNLEQFFGYITTLAEVAILSINRNLGDIWFSVKDICKIDLSCRPQHIVYPLI
jgi:hypothetical protein